nr:glutathione s-transferase 3 [Quercus suber]
MEPTRVIISATCCSQDDMSAGWERTALVLDIIDHHHHNTTSFVNMITLHHLGISQSERIVWLLEELGLDYKLVRHTREPLLAPKSLEAVPGNTTGKAPFISDDAVSPPLSLSESGAICDYIIALYGNGRFQLKAGHPNFADYLYWFHYSNANLQSNLLNSMFLSHANAPEGTRILKAAEQRLHAGLQLYDDRLRSNKWLAGDEFTAADIMSVFPLTTQRYFGPPNLSLKDYPNILRWLQDCAARPAYSSAMQKGDPEMQLLLEAEPPAKGLMELGGTASDSWKKGARASKV